MTRNTGGGKVTLSEAAEKVIDLAQKVRAYYDLELPKRHPNYPVMSAAEALTPPPPQEKALRKFLNDLPPELVYQLILVMYLGRGDFGADDLAGNYEALRETFGEPAWAVSQMMEKAPLADYLADGLAQLKEHGIDVNNLPLRGHRVPRR